MREYKFRAWDEELGEMLYSETKLFDDLLGFRFKHFEADKPIFMQYTGIKDINGKEVYEGDIVEFYARTSHTTRLFVIKYLDEDTTFRGVGTMNVAGSQRIDSVLSLINADVSLKVVGDIFTTPELIKEAD